MNITELETPTYQHPFVNFCVFLCICSLKTDEGYFFYTEMHKTFSNKLITKRV